MLASGELQFATHEFACGFTRCKLATRATLLRVPRSEMRENATLGHRSVLLLRGGGGATWFTDHVRRYLFSLNGPQR